MMKKIKLPPGFKIEVYAPNVLAARQMAWGDKGTLFVRLLRSRQRLCNQGQRRQERGQDHSQGPRHADRARLQGWRALCHRRQQADQV